MKSFSKLMAASVLLVLVLSAFPMAGAGTAHAAACDLSQFVADVSVPDGTVFAPGTSFTKTWRLINIGTCTWTTSYTLVFYSGDRMGAPVSVNFPGSVAPGQTVDLSVSMTAPYTAGHYRGNWKLKNASGVLFGIAFYVDIYVDPSAPTFSDVSNSHWAWSYIERLYNAGITGGCNLAPLQYCPETTVTRDQMAVFLLRGIHSSTYNPPAVGASTGFGDVPTNYWAAGWIKQLAAEGITGGCGSSNYCPEYPVTRDQMAVFLLRSKYGSSYSPPAVGASTGFGDVPTNHWAAGWIKQLVNEGITSGCGSGNYCPDIPVSRAQMAVFLVRTFSLP